MTVVTPLSPAVSWSTPHTTCRVCGAGHLTPYLDLGRTPLANALLQREQLDLPEFREELVIQLCEECGLSQLSQVVNRDLMFRNYLYVSSTPATFRAHCAALATNLVETQSVPPGKLVLDIASNDGCLLRAFRDAGMSVLGVDPAANLAAEANASGVPTICDYWSVAVARQVVARHGRPAIITALNVVAHVDNLHDFFDGIAQCLAPDGVCVIECPYVLDFMEHNEFDTAYHEHLSYAGVTPIAHLMAQHGLAVFNVEHFPELHGGTIRVLVGHVGAHEPGVAVNAFIERERDVGLTEPGAYQAFAGRVHHVRDALRALLQRLHNEGQTIWAYGASAKGNTLANYAGLTSDLVPVVVDDNPRKWNLYCPGSHMRIAGTAELAATPPDYLLLLAWNFEGEIRQRSRAAGFRGQFIVPVPTPVVSQ